MSTTITERVAAGAKFLDEHEPGWDQRINLDTLSIASACRCILGQLHGGFSLGLKALGFLRAEPDFDVALGFMWDTENRDDREHPDDLTAEWVRVITGRRAAP